MEGMILSGFLQVLVSMNAIDHTEHSKQQLRYAIFSFHSKRTEHS